MEKKTSANEKGKIHKQRLGNVELRVAGFEKSIFFPYFFPFHRAQRQISLSFHISQPSEILTLSYTWSLKKVPLAGGAFPYREYPLGPIESLCGNGQSVAYTDAHNTESDSENTVSSHSQKLTHYKDSESINQLANEQPAWQAQKWEGKGGGRKAGKSEQDAGAPLPGD